MAACVNLARRMIASERALSSLIQLGNLFEKETQLEAWYKPEKMEDVAKKYVELVLKKWPSMVDDHTFTSADHLGSSWRTTWDTDFDTHEHAITMNGSRFNDLCAAGREAQGSSDLNSKAHQRYRRFVVIHACTMVHELGHIYLTFLSMGGTHTPDSIGSLSGGTSQDSKAEAGSHLECLIFGGVMMPMRNPAEGNEQSGELHMVDENDRLRQISQDTVDKTCRYEFEFPFPTNAVSAPEAKQTLGYLQPLGTIEDPLRQPETIALLNAHKHFGAAVNPFNWKDVEALMGINYEPTTIPSGPQSDIHRLPFEPWLADEAAK